MSEKNAEPSEEVQLVRLFEIAKGLVRRGWAREVLARNRRGEPVAPVASDATRFCADGALLRAGRDMEAPYGLYELARRLVTATLRKRKGAGHLTSYNDRFARRREDICTLFDEAAEPFRK